MAARKVIVGNNPYSPRMNRRLDTHDWAAILLILLLSFGIRLYHNGGSAIQWDSAVYVGMGKYIWSGGQAGMWEDVRPLLLPFMLGFSWKIGLDPIGFGHWLMTLFSLGAILLTYLVSREIFSRMAAVFAATAFSISHIFIQHNAQIMTEIPALFFALLGIYALLRNWFLWAGIFFSLSFLTRFLFLGFFAFALAVLLIRDCHPSEGIRKKSKRAFPAHFLSINAGTPWLRMFFGFSILVIPFLLLNLSLYSNPLLPFLRQVEMSRYTGWHWWEPWYFYLVNFWHGNAIMLLAFAGALLAISQLPGKRSSYEKKQPHWIDGLLWGKFIAALFLAYFAYFSIIRHKEMRFSLTFLPLMAMLSAYALVELYRRTNRISMAMAAIVLSAALLIWAYQSFVQAPINPAAAQKTMSPFQQYLAEHEIKDGLWTSSPEHLAYSSARAKELIYYWTLDEEKLRYLDAKLERADYVLIDSCDIPCPPWESKCSQLREDFFTRIAGTMQKYLDEENEGCRRMIYSRSPN